jgi:hypothetical protein
VREGEEQTSSLAIALSTSASLTHGNSSTPLSIRKHLNPRTPSFAKGIKSSYANPNTSNQLVRNTQTVSGKVSEWKRTSFPGITPP